MHLSADTLTLRGEVFTVANGFLTRHNGEVRLPYTALLSVTRTKHRSKKTLYACLIIGSILTFTLDFADIIPGVITAVLTLLAVAIGVFHFLNAKEYVEIISMHGTYHVAINGDPAVNQTIAELRLRM